MLMNTLDELTVSMKAVSEEIRIRILLLLLDREACVCELMAVFSMAQSKLSHHLITLRDAGLLQDEKRGKWNYYRASAKRMTPGNQDLIASLSRRLAANDMIAKDRATLQVVKERMAICC